MKNILEKHPLTTSAIQKWIAEEMRKTAIPDSVVMPEEIKESFKNYVISLDKLMDILGNNPRSLLDFFDEHEVYILPIMIGGYFSATINGEPLSGTTKENNFFKRKDAENKAVEEAFPLLETNLNTDERDEEE